MKLSALLTAAVLAALATPHHAQAQTPQGTIATATGALSHFEAATIKPPDPKATSRAIGFYGSPGGKIHFGGQVNMLVMFAFGLQQYQVTGGPAWAGSEWFEIDAVPPDNSPSRAIATRTADPTAEQRQMLQSLLRDRFGLKCHMVAKEGEVYILTRGTKELQLKPPQHPDRDPRALVYTPSRGDDNSSMADVIGYNTTTDYLARRLERYLELPVLNQTEIAGTYDFDVPEASENNEDPKDVMLSVVDRLGLKIKRARGPVQTLVIDHVEHPNAN